MKKRNDIFQGAALSKALMLAAFAAGMAGNCQAEEIQLRSKWDENLLNVELHDVSIDPNIMTQAWQQMGKKYLLRCNLYMDADSPAIPRCLLLKRRRPRERNCWRRFWPRTRLHLHAESRNRSDLDSSEKRRFQRYSSRGSIP